MGLSVSARALSDFQGVARRFQRVGSTETLTFKARVLAATHQDLEQRIAGNRFREDLYYRLNVVSIELPRLSARREDILPLARHFLARFAAQYGLPVPRLDDRAGAILQARPWAGNVRELRNEMERAIILNQGGALGPADFPEPKTIALRSGELPFPATMRDITRAACSAMLERCDGNKSEAARRLGISRARLMRLLDAATIPDDDDLEVHDA